MNIGTILSQLTAFLEPFLSLNLAIFSINILIAILSIAISSYLYRIISSGRPKANSLEDEARRKSDIIIENARKEASKILETSTKKAQELLQGINIINDKTVQTLTHEIIAVSEQHKRYLKDASLKYVETYEHMAEKAQEDYLATLHAASQGMANDARQTLGMFETYLREQTTGYKQAMEKKIEQLRLEANAYVDEYRKDKLKRTDKAINEIILIVAKNIIGRSLNVKEHNELIIRALEEAKKEGFFSHINL